MGDHRKVMSDLWATHGPAISNHELTFRRPMHALLLYVEDHDDSRVTHG